MTTRKQETAHALFNVSADADEVPEVHSLTIMRLLDGGRSATYPGQVLGVDCPDVAALYALVGGGAYDVQAKSAQGRVTTRQRYEFEGPPKPFPQFAAPQQPAVTAPAPARESSGGGQAQLFAMMMQQQQQNTTMMMAMFERMAAQQQSASADMAKVMAAALAGNRGDGGAANAALLKTVLDAKLTPAGGGNMDVLKIFMKGVEMGTETAGGDAEDTLGDIAEALKAASSLAEMGKNKPPGGAANDNGVPP